MCVGGLSILWAMIDGGGVGRLGESEQPLPPAILLENNKRQSGSALDQLAAWDQERLLGSWWRAGLSCLLSLLKQQRQPSYLPSIILHSLLLPSLGQAPPLLTLPFSCLVLSPVSKGLPHGSRGTATLPVKQHI